MTRIRIQHVTRIRIQHLRRIRKQRVTRIQKQHVMGIRILRVKKIDLTVNEDGGAEVDIMAPNDIAYTRWSCHSGLKLLCKLCRTSPPQKWGPDLPFIGHAGHADPLDGWRCCSQKWVMSRPIQVQQLQTSKSGFVISAINKYMSESRYP